MSEMGVNTESLQNKQVMALFDELRATLDEFHLHYISDKDERCCRFKMGRQEDDEHDLNVVIRIDEDCETFACYVRFGFHAPEEESKRVQMLRRVNLENSKLRLGTVWLDEDDGEVRMDYAQVIKGLPVDRHSMGVVLGSFLSAARRVSGRLLEGLQS